MSNRNCKCHQVLMRDAGEQPHTIACESMRNGDEMNELQVKITQAMAATSVYSLYDQDTIALTNYLWSIDSVRNRVIDKSDLRDVALAMRDPSKKLLGKGVRIKQYIGDERNEEGFVRAYDPKSKKWWVTNMNMPYQGTVSAWFAEDELIEL